MFNRPRVLALLALWLMLIVLPASAQETAYLTLFDINTEDFPTIVARLRAYNAAGEFIHDLSASEVQIMEDGRPLAVESIRKQAPGAQFVVAINTGPAFAIKDNRGTTRFDHIQQALSSWIAALPSESSDDLSLVTNDGFEGLHYNRAVAWLSRLREYTPDFDTTVPGLEVLVRAIAIATDAAPQEGMGRGILLITPVPNQASLAALPSLLSLAQQNQVRVSIWIAASRAYSDSAAVDQLTEFATQTGGSVFFFSGGEELPAVDNYIEPLRYAYTLRYQSRIATGGEHQIAARLVSAPEATSAPLAITLQVQPPNPIFIFPPLKIERQENESGEFSPQQSPLELIIEFPDGHQRPLTRTTLYVDGEPVAENTTPPFNRFNWDVSKYLDDGEYRIRVEAVDDLGLIGSTIEHRVQVLVQRTPIRVTNILRENIPAAAGVGVAILLSLGLLLLIASGKLQPRTTGRLTPPRKVQTNGATTLIQPSAATPPSAVATIPQRAGQRISRWVGRFSRLRPPADPTPAVAAFLEPLPAENGKRGKSEVIQLWQREMTIGSDPQRAAILLKDPSVDEIHARIIHEEDGQIRLYDADSIAGTWLNFQPLSPEGASLTHGDILHIGKIGLRFKWRDSNKIPRPRVMKINPTSPAGGGASNSEE